MAVSLTATIQRFQGLSSDTKPASAPEGSTFHAVDTGEQWVYHQDMWERDLRLIYALQQAAAL